MSEFGRGDIMIVLEILAFIGIAIGGLLGAVFINDIGASEGVHTGYITAVEHNENLIWDSDLVYIKSSVESTQEDIYCIRPELIAQAQEYAKNGQRISITFKNNLIVWNSECNGGISIITGMTE